MIAFGISNHVTPKEIKPTYSKVTPMGEKKSKKGIPRFVVDLREKESMIDEITFLVKAGVEYRDDIYDIMELENKLPSDKGKKMARTSVYKYIRHVRNDLDIYPIPTAQRIVKMHEAGFSRKEISIALKSGWTYIRDCLRNKGHSKKTLYKYGQHEREQTANEQKSKY